MPVCCDNLTCYACVSPNSTASSKVLDDKSLWDLLNELYDQRTKWKQIGLGLSVSESDLDAMSGDLFDCLKSMLSKWLKGINPPPTWERLVAVLRSKVVDEVKKAKEIEEKFCNIAILATASSPTALPGIHRHVLEVYFQCFYSFIDSGTPTFVGSAPETNTDGIPLGSPGNYWNVNLGASPKQYPLH